MSATFREKENVPDAAVFGVRGYVSRTPEERCFGLKNTVSFLVFEVTAELPQYRGEPKPVVLPVEVFNRRACDYLRAQDVTLGAEVLVTGELTAKQATSAKGTKYTIIGLKATDVTLRPSASKSCLEF